MSRDLTRREHDVLIAMVEHAQDIGEDASSISADQRLRWRQQVATSRVYGTCGCGECPSIELGDARGATPTAGPRTVLTAARGNEALLLLFIDDDQLSYLEMAPMRDGVRFEKFPDPAELTY